MIDSCDRPIEYDWWYLITLGGKTSIECANNIYTTVIISILCVLVITGYLIIARSWYLSEQKSKHDNDTKAVSALRNLRIAFVWCAICGYGFFIIRTFVAAWSPYIVSLIILLYYTYRYVYQLKDLDIVYKDLDALETIKSQLQIDKNESVDQMVTRILAKLESTK